MKRTAAVIIAVLLFLLCLTGTTAAQEMIQNGDFSNGFTGWTKYTSGEVSASDYARITVEGGGAHYEISAVAATGGTSKSSYADLAQSVDLTNVQYLTFKTKNDDYEQIYPSATLVLYVKSGSTTLGSYTFNNLGSSWKQQSIDVSNINRQVTLVFEGIVTSEVVGTPTQVSFYVTDISAVKSAPVFTSSSVSPSATIQTGSQISLTYAFTGYPTGSTYICWGDSESYYTYDGFSGTQTHTYNQAGTYQISMYAVNAVGSSSTVNAHTIEVVTLDFSVYGPSSGNAPFDAEFTYSASSNIASLSWNFGDGGTSASTVNPTTHRYTGAGTYTVTLTGTTSLGQTLTVTKANLINTESQSISWGAASYDVGSAAALSWSLRNPDFTNHNYYIYVYQSVSDGTWSSQNAVYTYQIPNAATTTHSWTTTGMAGGYYSAYLYQDSEQLTHTSPAVSLKAYVSLTVNLAVSGVTYTNSTTVTLLQNGVTVQTQSTSSGNTVFNNVATGNYQVQAETIGYATQYANVVLSESTAITIDFVTGTTDGNPGGMGYQYAANYVTFRCYDSGTGKPLSGVTVNVIGREATNPVEWMANLLGNAWGSVVIGTNLSGVSDSNGVVTFAMVPNVRYEVTVIYGDYTATKVFQPSTLTGEYPLELDITKWNPENKYALVTTAVTPTESKTIIANYTDSTATTQYLNVTLWEIVDDKRVYISSQQQTTNTFTTTFTPDSPSGRSYVVTINATTTKLGEITREYAVDFTGPRILLGTLPDNFYIIISFLILAMVGGVGTIVTSRMYCLVVVIVAAFLWYAGWLFALGTVGSVVLLLCFVLAIIYYIASKSGGE